MEVFLVRHGQTDGNVGRRHQHAETKLNDHGRAQAAAVAAALQAQQPTHLITSTNVRAVETARMVGLACDLIPTTDLVFEELHQPKSMVGERLTGLRAVSYMLQWFFGINAASKHDGETYAAFVSRLAAARAYLEALPPDSRVVIVSHSVFINFFVEHMQHPRRMGLRRAVVRFTRILTLKNSSITHVRYTPKTTGRGTGWHLIRGK